jgi:hypothetical protein
MLPKDSWYKLCGIKRSNFRHSEYSFSSGIDFIFHIQLFVQGGGSILSSGSYTSLAAW